MLGSKPDDMRVRLFQSQYGLILVGLPGEMIWGHYKFQSQYGLILVDLYPTKFYLSNDFNPNMV